MSATDNKPGDQWREEYLHNVIEQARNAQMMQSIFSNDNRSNWVTPTNQQIPSVETLRRALDDFRKFAQIPPDPPKEDSMMNKGHKGHQTWNCVVCAALGTVAYQPQNRHNVECEACNTVYTCNTYDQCKVNIRAKAVNVSVEGVETSQAPDRELFEEFMRAQRKSASVQDQIAYLLTKFTISKKDE